MAGRGTDISLGGKDKEEEKDEEKEIEKDKEKEREEEKERVCILEGDSTDDFH